MSDTIRQFMRHGVVINGFTFDRAIKDPMQKAVRDALIGFMAALGGRRQKGSSSPNAPESNVRSHLR